ncbi:hypothetical protein CTAM01_01927 [Colletotrichum tamarilloi]|nr:uncharacterized protein CTAM01_01927 [Colletotrichum tamarilloi]KAI3541813.1 hypothetical protein CSPX01_07321 [Colletotrichum filicis]KAK1509804.1 hypothetical protein CTAM01_01927 [Colletotrichum tamarilloi]
MRRFDTSLGNRLLLHAPLSFITVYCGMYRRISHPSRGYSPLSLRPSPCHSHFSPAQAPPSLNPSGPTSVRTSKDTTGSSHQRHNHGPTPRSALLTMRDKAPNPSLQLGLVG